MAATASSVSPPSPVSPVAVRLLLQAEQWQQLQLQQLQLGLWHLVSHWPWKLNGSLQKFHAMTSHRKLRRPRQ